LAVVLGIIDAGANEPFGRRGLWLLDGGLLLGSVQCLLWRLGILRLGW